MKTLKFRKFKVKMILDGSKTSSLRLFDDKDLKVGDDLELIVWETGEKFTNAKIIEIIEKPVREIDEEDLVGHEKYDNNNALLENLRNYYPNTNETTPAKIIRFKIKPLFD